MSSLEDSDKILDGYWREMYAVKAHACYHAKYSLLCKRKMWWVDLFVLTVTCGGVGSWLIWKDYSNFLSGIVAFAYLLSVIKLTFPYNERADCCNRLAGIYDTISMDFEDGWSDIQAGDLTLKEISKKTKELRRRKNEMLNACIGNPHPVNNRLLKNAETEATDYFQNLID
ncbi:hypothetical protein [Maridesulfovibrio frigidus]|uniref:hypothetical protein n=1 Tax=Maridesulfovibrio frigidus TaxID=340956 RepID=UPI0004E0E029|nr:hypothetical protein [Maridesulfovibrio frigidus]